MKCWRDLSHECSANDCPMWMEEFDLPEGMDENAMGLGSSKCALAIKEKLGVYMSMLDMFDTLEEISGEEFFRQVGECALDRSRQAPACNPKPIKTGPAIKKQKKQTPI